MAVYDAGVDLAASPTVLVPIDAAQTSTVITGLPAGSTVYAQAYAADVFGNPSEPTDVVSHVAATVASPGGGGGLPGGVVYEGTTMDDVHLVWEAP